MTSRILLVLGSFAVSVLCLSPGEIEAERSGWSASPNTQYHIQTDEGPERYFRFQTLNGQYRKEKRLADGTVIGTEGWLDPLGYLRLKDYIADREGFRILKSKMVYVGKDRPIQDALAEAKKVPAQTGILAKPRRPPNPFRKPQTTNVAPLSGNDLSSGYLGPSTIRPRIQPTYVAPMVSNYYPTTPRPSYGSVVDLQNLDTYVSPQSRYYPSRPLQILQSPVNPYDSSSSSSSSGVETRPVQILEAPINRESSPSPTSYSSRSPISSAVSRADATGDFPEYDGTHSTGNGFQYYLRRHYHEEEREPTDGSSVGSFGYIDPFGIRRVVYYKTDPYTGGFVHKKNNRYVGFAATPYDPLPPDLSTRDST